MSKVELEAKRVLEKLFGKPVVIVYDKEPFQSESVSVKRLGSIESELKAMNPLLTPILLLSTSCYQIDEALGLVRNLQGNNRHYEVVVPGRLGSLGTVLSLGANKIHMTRMGALSSIDATLSGHGYPFKLFCNSICRHINIAELSELSIFSQKLVSSDPSLLLSIEKEIENYVPSRLRLSARQREFELKEKLFQIIKTSSELAKPEHLVNFLLSEAGSFDYWMYYHEVKKMGLNVNLIPVSEELEVLRINRILRGL